MMETPDHPTPLRNRLREGLSRVSAVLRMDDWTRAKAVTLNPTQYAILTLLEGRPEGLGVGAVAFHLGVSQPTATDSVAALERKGLLIRRKVAEDRRGVRVSLTDAGVQALREADAIPGVTEAALTALPKPQQEELLLTLVTLIRQLQEAGAIPIQRMCASCRFFQPHAHDDAVRPHHCKFVDAAIGPQDLRIDCREHETADPAVRAATWTAFDTGRSSLQA